MFAMRKKHQSKYVVRAALERCIRELAQARADIPFPDNASDEDVRRYCDYVAEQAIVALEESLTSLEAPDIQPQSKPAAA
jgi:hypothetical protein